MKDVPVKSLITATILLMLVSTLINGLMIKFTLTAMPIALFGESLEQISKFAVILGCILAVCLGTSKSELYKN